MKKYNIDNYVKYKRDIELQTQKLEDVVDGDYTIYNRNEMIICFTPLVENLARKFSTSQQASGVMTILDLIQEGNAGLTQAVDRLDYKTLMESEDQEKTLKSFLSKRIKGAIRRGIDQNRGDIRIPEHKMNEIRRNFGRDKKMVEMFFNSIFLSIDKTIGDTDKVYEIPDKPDYSPEMLSTYLKSLLNKHLNKKEYEVLRLSYGLDCPRQSAKQIADILNIKGSSAYVRVSQLKKQAVKRLIDNVDHSQVVDYLPV